MPTVRPMAIGEQTLMDLLLQVRGITQLFPGVLPRVLLRQPLLDNGISLLVPLAALTLRHTLRPSCVALGPSDACWPRGRSSLTVCCASLSLGGRGERACLRTSLTVQ